MNFSLNIRTAEELADERAVALVAQASRLIQAHIDATAQERGYFDALACVSYRGDEEEPVWAAEAEAFHRWRTRVWRNAHQLLAEVEAGTAVPPADEAELFERLELPPMVWLQEEGPHARPASGPARPAGRPLPLRRTRCIPLARASSGSSARPRRCCCTRP